MTDQEEVVQDLIRIRGRVKFYKPEDGYGFIVGEDNQDYYFNLHDISYGQMPSYGDLVTFVPMENFSRSSRKKNKTAKDVKVEMTRVEETQRKKEASDDRIICPGCKKRIVPRMITYQGSPDHSVCPYCGTTIKDFSSSCFIATAVFGDRLANEVIALRRFRNESLVPYWWGKIFVKLYYRVGPKLASWVSKSPSSIRFLKVLLTKLAAKYDPRLGKSEVAVHLVAVVFKNHLSGVGIGNGVFFAKKH